MTLKRRLALACGFALTTLSAAEFAPEDFLILSNALSPEVKMAIQEEGKNYVVRLEAENPYAALTIRLGADAGKTALIPVKEFPAEVTLTPEQIGGTKPLRLALEASWFDRGAKLRQREIFLAPSLGTRLPAADVWPVFDYAAYRKEADDRKQEIHFTVEQPMSGKLSVVIETPEGKRVRNLVSGLEYGAGKQTLVWDGRDELGNLVAPGKYRFRSASHPGIVPTFRMQYANGDEKIFSPWGANHGTMTALAVNDRYVFAAASITEGGNAIVALTPEGKLVRGYHQVGGAGIEEVFLAADDNRLYVLNDGGAWSGRGNEPATTLTVYDIESGNVIPPKGGNAQYSILYRGAKKEWKPEDRRTFPLTGAALADSVLYVSNREQNQVMKVDPETGKVTGNFALPEPGPLAWDGQKLYAVSGRKVVTLDRQNGKVAALFTLPYAPRGLYVRNQEFFVSGAPDSTIKVYGPDGRARRTVGKPGGGYAGAWQPERLVEPVGVAVTPAGELWVAENRQNPKRISRWNAATGKLLYEKVGCPAYGSPGGGVDPANGELWVGHRCLWDVDYEKGTSAIHSVMQLEGGHLKGKIPECFNYRFVHQDGRTFLLGLGKAGTISEVMPDGSVRDLALVSTVHQLFFALNWKRVPVFNDLVEKTFDRARPDQNYGDPQCRSVGVLWVDKNGNGDFDEGEFEFLPPHTVAPENGGWGMRAHDLTLHLPYRNEKGEFQLLTLKPDGFNQVGAPNYSFRKALANAVPIREELPSGVRTITEAVVNDSQGRAIVNSDPFMLAFRPDGTIDWLLENRWTNVHGSHNAPLPQPGEMQGNLFALGCAPLDDQGDVMVWIGNHGRLFVVTSDGLYLDEMFSDCRVAEVVGPGLIGGEPFGGNFEYDRKHRRYLLTGGTSGYRIYTLAGLDQVKRGQGEFTVTPEMIAAAERRTQRAAESEGAKVAAVSRVPDGKINFDQLPVSANWSSSNWEIRAKAAFDSRNLYLEYLVTDLSPWVNNGKDWTRLFKTGDAVDFQLGTDPNAPAARDGAAPGDLRLSIAPYQGGNLAVLYRYRLTDQTGANPVEFASPWRSEKVDDVKQLKSAQIEVQRFDWGYRVRATVPLAELGLTDPAGKSLRGDFGVIYGDRDGTINLSRRYWSNQATGLVNDVPGETMLAPKFWGTLNFGE